VAYLSDGVIPVTGSPEQLRRDFGQRTVEVVTDDTRQIFDLDGIGNDDAFAALIRRGNIASIHSSEATLDDIFIKATQR
jgi:fluoroquinolone transport system ATP-binding protein